ncbi:antitoxin VbhA family protein [Candidatus Nomurabacteria bacterium]|jgi:hypothetical protein|nr:antitoxin VbhA family protein [Candidatus Saccharibacteria bacterium]MCA9313185.1 antitoxin VbhA family protein [Candidatus Saccharibacteria bacterium]MCB9821987.1 antitoxin VbhA family protein [Candidatus Nomurabacteria bacterium]
MDKQSKRRTKNVQQAVANERLEGLRVSRDSLKIAENYIVGKSSAKQVAKKIRARYGAL